MTIDWTLEIKTDDGYILFEQDGVIDYHLDYEGGEYFVEVDGFEVTPFSEHPSTSPEQKPAPVRFDADAKQAWIKLLFFQVKADLEADQSFIDHVLEQEDITPYDPRDCQRLLACELI